MVEVMGNNTNLENITACLEENFGKTIVDCSQCYRLQDRPVWMLHLHASIVTIIIIISLLGSSLVLLLIIKYKKLRHKTAMVSLSVIAADTVLVFSYHLPVLISSFYAEWIFMFIGCQIFGFLSTNFILARWFFMGVLALDRFCIVRFPFTYPKIDRYVLIFLTILSWIVPSFLSIGTVSGFAGVAFRENVPSCLLYSPGIKRGMIFYSLIVIITFLIGGVAPIVLYSWLFWHARKLSASTVNVGTIVINNSRESILNTPNGQTSSNNNYKAVVTFTLIFVTFFLTGIPAASFQILRSWSIKTWCKIPPLLHFIVVEIFLSSTALDPLLVMRDRDFRKRLKYMLLCRNKCGRYYNNSVVYPASPAERGKGTLKTTAEKNVSVPSLTSDDLHNTSSTHDHNSILPRSGSAPAQNISSRIPKSCIQNPIKDTIIEEVDNNSLIKEEYRTDSDSSSKETKIIYTCNDDNVECIEVQIKFDD